jgi:hypothetical protein
MIVLIAVFRFFTLLTVTSTVINRPSPERKMDMRGSALMPYERNPNPSGYCMLPYVLALNTIMNYLSYTKLALFHPSHGQTLETMSNKSYIPAHPIPKLPKCDAWPKVKA